MILVYAVFLVIVLSVGFAAGWVLHAEVTGGRW